MTPVSERLFLVILDIVFLIVKVDNVKGIMVLDCESKSKQLLRRLTFPDAPTELSDLLQ